jgi:hypothetical protein
MRIRTCSAAGTVLLALVVLILGVAPASGAQDQQLDVALCAPNQNTFTIEIDNRFFPLPVGQQWVLAGNEQGQNLGLQITVLDATERLYRGRQRVTTRVVEEREWEDTNGNASIDSGENLIEVSTNFFAQTQDDTVCYFGEEVDIYANGVVVSHEGSWRADADGNAPGIFMPADPQVGMTYQQEVAPGVAEDEATITRRGAAKVSGTMFDDTITVRDFNPLDGSKGTKIYAAGIGIIRDGPLDIVSF